MHCQFFLHAAIIEVRSVSLYCSLVLHSAFFRSCALVPLSLLVLGRAISVYLRRRVRGQGGAACDHGFAGLLHRASRAPFVVGRCRCSFAPSAVGLCLSRSLSRGLALRLPLHSAALSAEHEALSPQQQKRSTQETHRAEQRGKQRAESKEQERA